jgi:hypothetical protein
VGTGAHSQAVKQACSFQTEGASLKVCGFYRRGRQGEWGGRGVGRSEYECTSHSDHSDNGPIGRAIGAVRTAGYSGVQQRGTAGCCSTVQLFNC